MCTLNFLVEHFSPVIVQYIIAESADVVVSPPSTGISDYPVCGRRVDAFLQVPESGIVCPRVAIRLERFFQD